LKAQFDPHFRLSITEFKFPSVYIENNFRDTKIMNIRPLFPANNE
jgi:hypothetical protein